MAKCSVLYWRSIPSMVEARDGEGGHKVQLSDRFQELIDIVAMRRGLAGTDQYLSEWRRERCPERDGDARSVAEAMAREMEAGYEDVRAAALRDLET